MEQARVRFDYRMTTVFVGHGRVIDKVLRHRYDLTSTEFCILRALYLSDGRSEGIDFARFLNLKKNSISTALSKLEARGMVSKSTSPVDRRVVIVSETERGTQTTREATADIYDLIGSTFWRGLDIEDKLGGNRTAALVLERLRGVPTQSVGSLKEGNTPITSEFIVFCKVLPQIWTRELHAFGLSLSEFRVLDMLVRSEEPMRATDVARSLFLERSVVSALKDGLVDRGLAQMEASFADRRNSEILCTPAGAELAARASERLQEVTDDAYSLCDDDLVARVNDWHARMYESMNVLNALL